MNQAEAPLFLPDRLLRFPTYLMYLLATEGRRQAQERGWKYLIPHLAVLASLDEFGSTSQKELSRRIQFDESDLVDLLRMLERERLVQRRKDPADARRHALALTPKGRTRLAQMERDLARRVGEFLGALSPREQDQLRDLVLRALASHDSRVRLTPPRGGGAG
ncbi:MAG TPA: MarR family transcriptional regulator [Myxococcaceae bacterium]|nr:MarR family transcriptional regulator [Myxococcaceae bacterium]